MPKSNLTAYKSEARQFNKLIKAEKQKEIANTLNISQQMVSYNINNNVFIYYFEVVIRLLDLLGYEIKSKE